MDTDDDTEHSWPWKANTTHEGSTEFFGWQYVVFQCLQGMTHICSCRVVKKEWSMSSLTNVGVLWLIGQGFTCMNSRAQLDGLGNSYDVCPNIFQKHVWWSHVALVHPLLPDGTSVFACQSLRDACWQLIEFGRVMAVCQQSQSTWPLRFTV